MLNMNFLQKLFVLFWPVGQKLIFNQSQFYSLFVYNFYDHSLTILQFDPPVQIIVFIRFEQLVQDVFAEEFDLGIECDLPL
jgi:hypothetical protein